MKEGQQTEVNMPESLYVMYIFLLFFVKRFPEIAGHMFRKSTHYHPARPGQTCKPADASCNMVQLQFG